MACDTASTQEQPVVVPGRPTQQQRITRAVEVCQLLVETQRTNDLLEARNVEDIVFHTRLLQHCRETTEVRSLTAAVRDLIGAVRETGAAMARAAETARADSVRLTEQVVLAVALIMRILQNQHERALLAATLRRLDPRPLIEAKSLGPWSKPSSQRTALKELFKFLKDSGLSARL
ncbi:uncharacterized protein LOC144102142 isoform X1 [Amblyomma americanum]